MQFLLDASSALVRLALKLVLFVAAIVFALGLLCVGLLTLVFVLLKALLTGRKPAFVTTFVRFQQASQQFRRGGGNYDPGAGQSPGDGFVPSGVVIDVEATKVHSDLALPQPPESDKP